MKRPWIAALLLALIAVAGVDAVARLAPANRADRPLAHMVFFTLKDHSEESRAKFVASCQENLTGHDGTLYFSVGTYADDVEEPVSVKDFDVALHVVFDGKAAKEKYLADPRHDKFVEENRESFAKVRVFDSYLAPEPR